MLLPVHFDFNGLFPRLSRKLRLGVVGGGRVSHMQAMAARLSNHWEIVAGAFSSDPMRAKSAADEWFVPQERCYQNFIEMAACEAKRKDRVDAVMITTPNHLHYPAAKAFIEAGIDVLCDKPLTNELDEAEALNELVQASDNVFGVSYVMSCFAMIRQARHIIKEGGVGKINQIHVEFMQDWMTPDHIADAPHVKWRLDPSKSGKTSCVGDIGTHAAHLATFVSHLPLTHLRTEFHVCGTPKPLEDSFFAWTRYAESIPGTLMATRLAPGNRGGLRLRVFGSKGGIEWDLENSEQLKFNRFGEADRIITRGHGHGVAPHVERLVRTARGFSEGIIEAWGNLYSEFAMSVAARKDGLNPPTSWLEMPRLCDGINGVRFIDACVRSNQSGGNWVDIKQ